MVDPLPDRRVTRKRIDRVFDIRRKNADRIKRQTNACGPLKSCGYDPTAPAISQSPVSKITKCGDGTQSGVIFRNGVGHRRCIVPTKPYRQASPVANLRRQASVLREAAKEYPISPQNRCLVPSRSASLRKAKAQRLLAVPLATIAPVGLPVGEPPNGSSDTASVAPRSDDHAGPME